MQKKILIILIFFAISVTYAKGVSDDIKYLDSASIYKQDIEKYKGVQYLFHSFIKYDNEAYPPPFPYKDGRVRDGKYKASETALDAYIKGLSKYNNKSFTLAHVDYSANNVKGIVMACENGDSLYVGISTIRQFINKEYFDGIKKLKGTKTIYQVPHSNYLAIFEGKCSQNSCTDEEILFPKQYPYFVGFTDVKTKKTSFYLPYLSTWKIVDVIFDTTFVGAQSSFSNRANMFFGRVRYTIKNEKYGEYYYFEDNLNKITKRNERIGKRDNCEKPIRDEYGRWSQKCSGKYRYWNDLAIFSPQILIPYEDCPHYTYDGLCSDSTAYLLQDWTKEYTDNEIKIINEWASKGFVEAIWTKDAILGDIKRDDLKKCLRAGYPPAFIYKSQFIRKDFFNSIDSSTSSNFFDRTNTFYNSGDQDISFNFTRTIWQDIFFDGLKNAYKIYGKQLALDIIFDQFKIYTSMDLNQTYKKAVKLGYDSARANEIINEYFKWKKSNEKQFKIDSTINVFRISFTKEDICKTPFDSILKQVNQFEKKYDIKKDDLTDLLWFFISARVDSLSNNTNTPEDDIVLFDSVKTLYTMAVSYGHHMESDILNATNINSASEGASLIAKIDSELAQDSNPEKIFLLIQQEAPKFKDNETFPNVYKKVIFEIIDKYKKNNKAPLTEINLLEKEIELYQLATKYGYKDGLDSVESKQKKLDYLRKKSLLNKSGK